MRACVALVALLAVCSALPLDRVLAPNAAGKNWAVLVAGSNTWGNYRHQADICHSYQVLIEHGFDANNIIVMMYDDIAHNSQNPTPGIIINHPNGKDVYHGVSKDYTGIDVTPENFLKVLKGDAEGVKGIGSGKVLNSGPNDNVFVFFSDHGASGLVAFPTTYLYAKDLINALIYMHDNKKYNQLVFYLEACESGSMFDKILPANINIFATTASTPDASSYACYWDATRDTYLGDVYSVNWMENSDAVDISKETLQEQFAVVKRKTNTSVCCEYGDQSFATQPVSYFQGATHAVAAKKTFVNPNLDAVDSRDVDIAILRHQIAASNGAQQQEYVAQLNTLMGKRAALEALFANIVSKAAGPSTVKLHTTRRMPISPAHMDCLYKAESTFISQCQSYASYDYWLKLAMTFVSMCESGVSAESIVSSIHTNCPNQGQYVGGVY